MTRASLMCVFAVLLCACSRPQPGPDKTVGGALLGAGWGAGTGAVIGHQLSYAGEGTAIGAGFGAVAGATSGATYDFIEQTQIEQENELAALRTQNAANAQSLAQLQFRLDQAISSDIAGGIYQVFFDPDQSNLRSGSIANLELIAEQIKSSPFAYAVNVVGHADDAGDPKYNERLAEARARNVSAYLSGRGLSLGQIKVQSFGSKRPIASNTSETGRQLNRRVDVFIGKNELK